MSKDPESNYYDAGGLEVLDIIKAKLTPEQYQGYLLGNAIKYLCRLMHKNADWKGRLRDAQKGANHAQWLLEEIEKLARADAGEVASEAGIEEMKSAYSL